MRTLQASDLMTLETYARERPAFRARVIAHKKRRTVPVGHHLTLLFEDRLTIKYQIQEMLRIERIFEPEGIAEELAAYNPLIPDGTNLKATLLIEFADATVRAERLRALKGLERTVCLVINGERVTPVADEDLERENDEKTSAVHFMRFPIPEALRAGFAEAEVSIDVSHPAYPHRTVLTADMRQALARDLQP
jgi:Protein of unknown function (DUF3501)